MIILCVFGLSLASSLLRLCAVDRYSSAFLERNLQHDSLETIKN